jgi:predicted nucleic acid-binding protein
VYIFSPGRTADGVSPLRALIITHAVQGKQVHDVRIAALMAAHGITHILTLNGADFTRYPAVTVLDPLTPLAPVTTTP